MLYWPGTRPLTHLNISVCSAVQMESGVVTIESKYAPPPLEKQATNQSFAGGIYNVHVCVCVFVAFFLNSYVSYEVMLCPTKWLRRISLKCNIPGLIPDEDLCCICLSCTNHMHFLSVYTLSAVK